MIWTDTIILQILFEKNYSQMEKYEHIMATCKPVSECVQKINNYILPKFDSEMTNQEEMYLVLHIHRLLEHS